MKDMLSDVITTILLIGLLGATIILINFPNEVNLLIKTLLELLSQ